MPKVALQASVEWLEDPDDPSGWGEYLVVVQPVGAPDAIVAGSIRLDRPMHVDLNQLGLPDNLVVRLLQVAFDYLFPEMDKLGGTVAQYTTPDCTAWLRRDMTRSDAEQVLAAAAPHAVALNAEHPVLWISS